MVMRTIRAKSADIQLLWLDKELVLPEAAARLGMSVDSLQDRAAALGLPHRKEGRREVIRPRQEKEFRLMWRAGVSARLIGVHFACSYFAVINTAKRLKLQPRGAAFKPRMTLGAYREARLGVSMRIMTAAETAVIGAAHRAQNAELREASPE